MGVSNPPLPTPVSIANGGTNNGSLAVTAGGVLYTDGSKLVNVGVGTAGQILQSNAGSAPTWVTSGASSPTTTAFPSLVVDNSGAITNLGAWYWVIGDRLYCQGSFIMGSPSASPFAINLPGAFTINTAKISTSANGQTVGYMDRVNGSVSYPGGGGPFILFFDGSTTTKIFYNLSAGTPNLVARNASANLNNGDGVQFNFNVPIS